jgi:oligopeptidase B
MKTLKNMVSLCVFFTLLFQLPIINMAKTDSNGTKPPVARKAAKTFTIHGDTRTDNYYWLREKTNPEVIAYLEAENEYTNSVMRPMEAFQESLYKEALGRLKQTDLSVPSKEGGYYYYSRTEEGKQYPIRCRKRGSLDAKEEITLDLNELAKGHKFLGLGRYEVSDDGNLLAYSIDTTGFRQYTLQFKDLRTGETLPDRIEKTVAAAWAADNKTIFYATEDHAKRPYRLYRHTLGNEADELVYEEKDELYRLSVERSRDKSYIFVSSASSRTSESRYIKSDKPLESPRVILTREKDHEYDVDHRNGLFYIRTNKGNKNFRVVTAPVSDPRPENWKDFIPGRKEVKIQGIDLFTAHAAVSEREDGLVQLRIIDFDSGKSHRIEMPESIYSASGSNNPEFNSTVYRFNYQSLITPSSVFDYDMNTRKRTLLKETEVLGGYDKSGYVTERIYATAQDGTRIPVSLVYKKGMKRDGSSPLLQYGYGSYGASSSPTFASARLSLLDRGVIYAIAHIRGGGDMGEEWHEQGRMLRKKNTFTDFISVADHLVKEKYTSRDRMVIEGGSAGGLLIGAVVNMRPDLCKAAILHVPFVDVINTMLDSSLPLTVGEYLEWGNPNDKEYYDYMKSYCPYTNIAAKDYPAMLVRTSLNDSQVMYWEPAKYVAKLRDTKTDKNVLLFKTNMGGGHGGSSGRYDALKDQAFNFAFTLWQMGITK